MTKLETELNQHGRWDIRPDFHEEGQWWAYREYDKCAGKGRTLLEAVRAANAVYRSRKRGPT